MSTPHHRQQFEAARDPYGARNALGITTWLAVDSTAPRGNSYGGPYELIAGTNVTFAFGTQTIGGKNYKTLSVSGTASGISDAPSDGNTYARKNAAWQRIDNNPFGYVLKTGDTMTGGLAIAPASGSAVFNLNKPFSGSNDQILGLTGGLARWAILLGDGTTEVGAGSNTGSNFSINRFNDAGTQIDIPLTIDRTSGLWTIRGNVSIIKVNPAFSLAKSASGEASVVYAYSAGNLRWHMALGDTTAESGSNAGSNFSIGRYNDAGTFIDNPLTINRATGLVSANIKPLTVQTFTSGSGTYTTPAGCRAIRIRMCGGGGGGGSFAAGGAGGNTTFSTLQANGGTAGTTGAGGAGGAIAAGGNVVNVVGGDGSGGFISLAGTFSGIGGVGAGSFFGGGGATAGYGGNGLNARAVGAGGGGGAANVAGGTLQSGGGGGAGAYIEHIIAAPAASYSYSVGAAGLGQAAGANVAAGGNGFPGIIIVEEYY